MTTLQVIWLSILVVVASYLCHAALINPIGMNLPRSIRRLFGRGLYLSVAGLALLVHIAISSALALNLLSGVVIAIVSAMGLMWGLFAYFLLQRFAGPVDRTGMVRNHPLLLPLMNGVLFSSSALAFGLSVGWLWAVLPLIMWFILGLVSAEIAIRRLMTRSEGTLNRQVAIFGVNQDQGRGLLGGDRYPFP